MHSLVMIDCQLMQIKAAVNVIRSSLKQLCDKMVPQVYSLYPSSEDIDAGIDMQAFIANKVNHLKTSGEYMHVGRDQVSGVCLFTSC
jgi:hypothetical protein